MRKVTIVPYLSYPFFLKKLEKIIVSQLTLYLETNNLLSENQHGFRSNLSTNTALLKLTNELYANMDNKKVSLITLRDLFKVFDSVSHEMLLTSASI